MMVCPQGISGVWACVCMCGTLAHAGKIIKLHESCICVNSE